MQLASARGVDPESIDVEALVSSAMANGTTLGDEENLEEAATPLRRGYDHVLAKKVMKIEEKVKIAIVALQRREEKMEQQREVHRTLTGLQDEVENRVAYLSAENQNLKKELERMEAQNEQLQGYMVDHLTQEELYELIKSLTGAVDRVRITVLTKKIALSGNGNQRNKVIALSSPEQRASKAKMSLEDMGKAIADLKEWGQRRKGTAGVADGAAG